jgi:hypothetical protein
MMVNMNETRLTTIAKLEEFLFASSAIEFKPGGDDVERSVAIRVSDNPGHAWLLPKSDSSTLALGWRVKA